MAKRAVYLVALLMVLAAGVAIGHFALKPAGAETARLPLYYEDPMHPSYRSRGPGKAPDCGMDLVAVYAEDLQGRRSTVAGPGSMALHIDAGTQRQYGIQVEQVEPVSKASSGGTVRFFGSVAADESRIYRVNLGTEGYVKETHGDSVGERVAKDQRLATVYAPEFLAVVGGYLSANERTMQPTVPMKDNSAPTANAASAQARADRLRNLGMSDSQIQEVSTSRKIPEDVYVVSPTDGYVLARNISPGLRFERHTDLYSIADLSRVWILAQVSGDEAATLRPGSLAEIVLPDGGGRLKARVSDALPEVDATSHTVTVRLEADNPRARLRPNMFVTVEAAGGARGTELAVPADAVVDSGLSKRVFVETAEGYFEPREVETGWHRGDRVQITKGLTGGETVAAAGTFLIDSESKLHGLSGTAKAPPPGAQAAAPELQSGTSR
ncbi:RND family efflux transporter MFP subunit [Granulicella aggregans]|uniref:RND family efflux transporter MFP subunit n=1 Tax=Granulicella aggregans TaxID=474949 RepID=A0A7W7ZF72_9BACT|nr:efflux RND transporter periplasmic adaptor subunit [Granulicella aggregans]MBB5058731.1 RND family efflux transporter MFP subunit [Granulicella aggregans]